MNARAAGDGVWWRKHDAKRASKFEIMNRDARGAPIADGCIRDESRDDRDADVKFDHAHDTFAGW